MLLTWLITAGLVVLSVILHYEALRLLDWWIRRLKKLHRPGMVLIVLGCFCAHIVEVMVFAVALFLSATRLQLGAIQGVLERHFVDYFYVSISSYTSLGVGDIYATGDLRIIVGVEALIGLMLITWSATFTFLEMKAVWEDRRV